MKEHNEGVWISVGALVAGAAAWFMRNIEVINSLMHFAILAVTLIASVVGLRKVLRR